MPPVRQRNTLVLTAIMQETFSCYVGGYKTTIEESAQFERAQAQQKPEVYQIAVLASVCADPARLRPTRTASTSPTPRLVFCILQLVYGRATFGRASAARAGARGRAQKLECSKDAQQQLVRERCKRNIALNPEALLQYPLRTPALSRSCSILRTVDASPSARQSPQTSLGHDMQL